ncbi:ribosome biogenesis protein BOP1 [Tanacetum coccineum]
MNVDELHKFSDATLKRVLKKIGAINMEARHDEDMGELREWKITWESQRTTRMLSMIVANMLFLESPSGLLVYYNYECAIIILLTWFQGFSNSTDSSKNSDSKSGSRSEQRESSDHEVETRNTIGDVPFEWYKEDEHIGYDKAGRKIKKMERMHKLDSILATSARRRFSKSKSRLPASCNIISPCIILYLLKLILSNMMNQYKVVHISEEILKVNREVGIDVFVGDEKSWTKSEKNGPNPALIKDEVSWFSTSGDNIASASVDGTIRIWTYDSSTSAVKNAIIDCGAEIMSLK